MITARRARYSNGTIDAMSHWLASSITTRSKNPGRKGTRRCTESDVTAQQGRTSLICGNNSAHFLSNAEIRWRDSRLCSLRVRSVDAYSPTRLR
jgi:hypothetical protein